MPILIKYDHVIIRYHNNIYYGSVVAEAKDKINDESRFIFTNQNNKFALYLRDIDFMLIRHNPQLLTIIIRGYTESAEIGQKDFDYFNDQFNLLKSIAD